MSELSAAPTMTVRQLRRLWKPHKERLQAARSNHPTTVRFHRACSWLQSVEAMGEKPDYDQALIAQWIAFNALYGQWDAVAKEPVADRESWRVFVGRICDLDAEQRLPESLRKHKPLVLSLMEDEHLSSHFWRDPDHAHPGHTQRKRIEVQGWYVQKDWKLILERVLDRVYLLRCQLVHGAATYDGQLNRKALRRCSTMMGHLLPAMLRVWIDHGAEEDWGLMCYPPLRSQARVLPRQRPK